MHSNIQHAAGTIGGYLGHEHAYFTEDGQQLAEGEGEGPSKYSGVVYIVTGNYYGTSVFRVHGGDIERIEDE